MAAALGCAPAAGTPAPALGPRSVHPVHASSPGYANSTVTPTSIADTDDAIEPSTSAIDPAASDEPLEDDLESRVDDDGTPQTWLSDPRLAISDADLATALRKDPTSLGSLSVGQASSGLLVGGKHVHESELWSIVSPGFAWGTEETIAYLERAIRSVHEHHPGGHPLQIGHVSAKQGGHLDPHRSHQSGRDVDISYFYQMPARHLWYRRATAHNLDVVRTWAFVRALVTETDVEYIFINTPIQRLIKQHALAAGEDAEWLDSVFQSGSRHRSPIVRHAPGHDTHIHVRFYSPIAQELGRRAYPTLVSTGRVRPSSSYATHKVRRGELLFRLAARYGTTVDAIQRANGLKNTRIRAGRVLRIPKQGKTVVVVVAPRIVVPARRLPPPPASVLSSTARVPRAPSSLGGGAAAPDATP